jgi:hypothetical protein
MDFSAKYKKVASFGVGDYHLLYYREANSCADIVTNLHVKLVVI